MESLSRFLLAALLTVALVVPTATFAKGGDDDYDDDHFTSSLNDDHDDDSDEDEDDDNGHHGRHHDNERTNDEDDSTDALEIEADVFTDTTIVKVELEHSRKIVFDTDANTREEVIDEVAERFDLTEAEVDAALNFEIEDRASRAKERARITGESNSDNSAITERTLRAYIVHLEALLEMLRARLGNI